MGLGHKLARIVVAQKLFQGRQNRQLNGEAIGVHIGNHIQHRSQLEWLGDRLDGGSDRVDGGATGVVARAAAAPAGLVKIEFRDDVADVHGFELGLPSTHRGHFRGAQQVCAAALFERAHHDPELRIGKNARNAGEGRRTVTQAGGQQVVRGAGRNGVRTGDTGNPARPREITARIGPTGGAVRAVHKLTRRSTALHPDRIMIRQRVAEIPVKAQRAAVVLGHFHELGADHHLGRGHVQHLHGLLDDVEITKRGPDHEDTEAVVVENCLARLNQ